MARQAHAQAVLLIVLASLCFSTIDTMSKMSGAFAPLTQVLFARYAVQFAATLLWWACIVRPRLGPAFFKTRHPRFHLGRGLLLALSTALCFTGLRYMPVGEFTAIAFMAPMLAMALAAWLLKERVLPGQWWLAALAFGGALVVIRPGADVFGWAVLFPLALALTQAGYQTLTRRLARDDEHPVLGQLAAGAVGTLIFSLPLFWPGSFFWDLLWWQWAVLVAMGLTATLGHFALLLAYARDTPAALAPFNYVQIAFAMLAGWVAFDHVPDAWAFAGMLLIGATGACSAWMSLRALRGQH